jgi:hypothetical protein
VESVSSFQAKRPPFSSSLSFFNATAGSSAGRIRGCLVIPVFFNATVFEWKNKMAMEIQGRNK